MTVVSIGLLSLRSLVFLRSMSSSADSVLQNHVSILVDSGFQGWVGVGGTLSHRVIPVSSKSKKIQSFIWCPFSTPILKNPRLNRQVLLCSGWWNEPVWFWGSPQETSAGSCCPSSAALPWSCKEIRTRWLHPSTQNTFISTSRAHGEDVVPVSHSPGPGCAGFPCYSAVDCVTNRFSQSVNSPRLVLGSESVAVFTVKTKTSTPCGSPGPGLPTPAPDQINRGHESALGDQLLTGWCNGKKPLAQQLFF